MFDGIWGVTSLYLRKWFDNETLKDNVDGKSCISEYWRFDTMFHSEDASRDLKGNELR
jgi:hypothetical protein